MSKTVALLDTSIDSYNMGDTIIASMVDRLLPELASLPRLPTHRMLTRHELRIARDADVLILTGTNILSSTLRLYGRDPIARAYAKASRHYRHWPIGRAEFDAFSGKVVFFGVGWAGYDDAVSSGAAHLISGVRHPRMALAVRDRYTCGKLTGVGIPAVNTYCPTMWRLPERLAEVSLHGRVVFTVTDYAMDPVRDQRLLDQLGRLYDEILLWPQGARDLRYLRSLAPPRKATIISSGLPSLRSALDEDGTEYVGTRLHSGIFAADNGNPTVVIAVDHRATEIGRDSGFPVIQRSLASDDLVAAIRSLPPVGVVPNAPVQIEWLQRLADVTEIPLARGFSA